MNQEERRHKINSILSEIKKQVDFPGIPIHLWITGAKGNPGEPYFEEWMRICTRYIDAYRQDTGKRDTDSPFFEYVRIYGRREYFFN